MVFLVNYFFKADRICSGQGSNGPGVFVCRLIQFLESLYMLMERMVSHTIWYPLAQASSTNQIYPLWIWLRLIILFTIPQKSLFVKVPSTSLTISLSVQEYRYIYAASYLVLYLQYLSWVSSIKLISFLPFLSPIFSKISCLGIMGSKQPSQSTPKPPLPRFLPLTLSVMRALWGSLTRPKLREKGVDLYSLLLCWITMISVIPADGNFQWYIFEAFVNSFFIIFTQVTLYEDYIK